MQRYLIYSLLVWAFRERLLAKIHISAAKPQTLKVAKREAGPDESKLTIPLGVFCSVKTALLAVESRDLEYFRVFGTKTCALGFELKNDVNQAPDCAAVQHESPARVLGIELTIADSSTFLPHRHHFLNLPLPGSIPLLSSPCSSQEW